MPLEYERPRGRRPLWHQVGRWVLFSLIVATFLSPFVIAAIAVLFNAIHRAARHPLAVQ